MFSSFLSVYFFLLLSCSTLEIVRKTGAVPTGKSSFSRNFARGASVISNTRTAREGLRESLLTSERTDGREALDYFFFALKSYAGCPPENR